MYLLFRAGLSKKVFMYFFLFFFCKFLGLDIVICFLHFLKENFLGLWSYDGRRNHLLSLLPRCRRSLLSIKVFPFYFDLAMYLYCLYRIFCICICNKNRNAKLKKMNHFILSLDVEVFRD